MVISRLNVDKIEKNLSLIQEFILKLRRLSTLPLDEFLSDYRNPASAESYLRRSLEAIFDTGRHILAKTYGFKDLEYKVIAKELGDKGVVDREYSRVLVKMAGYRNRMVHLYHEISSEEIYRIMRDHLPDIERFIKEMGRFLEDYKKGI
jgi:uncharacterized protein YutE (UPF0331/DUF86 family)